MSIVERIKNLCISQNTTIKALERELKLSNGSIKNWDTSSPSVERVQKVAKKFNVSIDWLVTGKESSNLSLDEQKLITFYRQADARGKRNIMRQAEAEHIESTKIG